MGILDVPWIDLCVLKSNDVHTERVFNDSDVWIKIKSKLNDFYFNFFSTRNYKKLSIDDCNMNLGKFLFICSVE